MRLIIARTIWDDLKRNEIMKILQSLKLNSFADHHRLFCFVVSFGLGLVACISIARLEAKQSTHKQLISPSELNAIGDTVETGDEFEIQHSENGNSKPIGQHVGIHHSEPRDNPNTASPEGPISQSLTSLRIRLQI